MRVKPIAKGLAVSGIAATAAIAAAERLVLRKVDRTPSPPGWRDPRWPDGLELTVPTDDGAELTVASSGPDGAPTAVLVHGLSGDHHSLGNLAELLLDRGFRVVGVNQRGHGGSTIGSEGFGPARQGADIGNVLTALDLGDVTLMGHSMGGVAAMSLLTLAPGAGADRVASLVVVASLADAVRRDRDRALRFQETDLYDRLRANPTHASFVARFVFGPTPSRRVLDDAITVGRRCPPATLAGAAGGMLGYDIRALLPTIDRPTTVICGTRDLLTRHGENEAIAHAIPGAVFRSVPGAGHMIVWEHPELIVDAIAARTMVREQTST